jgi:membrane protease YdiL (CAAX protease family)
MDSLRLNRKDGLFILICVLVFAAGLVISLKYFQKAFPEASINFRYNRAQTEDIALAFLKDGMGLTPPDSYRHAGRFGYDGSAKIYLEKELGVEGARKYLGHPVRLWRWAHRWFKPSTKEEFTVFVTPEGEISRADHQVDEDAAGADLPEDSARMLAEHFLFGTVKMDSAQLTFLESQRIGRPHRADWTFTYRAKDIEPVKDSQYRYSVGIIGDQVGSYREFLHVPEAWWQSFGRLRSFNEMAGSFSGIGLALTAIAMVIIFVLRIRKRDIRWRTAVCFGLVATGLMLLNQINYFPISLYGYDTTASWSGFLTREILLAVLMSVGQGIMIFFITAAAETLYRERYGDKMALPLMFTFRALRTKSAFKNILLGVTLTSFFLAYQIVFYLVAGRFGAWSPSDVPYDNLLNTAMPWLAVLMIGFFPAVSEEFISRAFSISFMQKILKNRLTWVALLLPAFIWGFGHSTYPNEPFYIRGVEVGLAGILIGVIMLKFGILATLVWHYTVDALYTALLLFRSENLYFIITAAVATGLLAIPLLIALAAYLRKGRFEPDAGVLNRDVAAPPAEPALEAAPVMAPPPTAIAYRPFASRRLWLAAAFLVVGVLAALVPVSKIGDFMSYPVTPEQAVKTFTDSLRATGWADPDTLTIRAFAPQDENADPEDPDAYLLKHAGSVSAFNGIAEERLLVGRWRVYAWKPEHRLRYMGSVDSKTGRIQSLYPILPEEMPGDSLTEAQARALVEAKLTEMGEDVSKLEAKEYSQQKRPKRLDHSFTYEAREGDARNVAEAKYRRGGNVDGNYLSVGRSAWYHIPEKWERDRKATTVIRAVKQGLTYLAIGGLIAWAVVLLALRTRKGTVPWKKAFLVAIVPGVLGVLTAFDQFSYLNLREYFHNIETPWGVFQTTSLIGGLIGILFVYLMFVLELAFLGGLYPEALGALRRAERRASVVDALMAVVAGIGLLLLARSVGAWLSAWQPEWITFSGWQTPEWLGAPAPLPLFEMLQGALKRALLMTFLLIFLGYLWSHPMKKTWLRICLIIGVVILFLPSAAVEPGEWLMAAVVNLVGILLAMAALRLVDGRPAPLLAMVFGAATYRAVSAGMGGGLGSVITQTWVVAVIALLGLLWWLGVFSKRSTV